MEGSLNWTMMEKGNGTEQARELLDNVFIGRIIARKTYWLDQILPHGHGNQMRWRHAGIGVPAEEGSVDLERRCSDLALEDVLVVLVDHRNRCRRDGGARVGGKRKGRI